MASKPIYKEYPHITYKSNGIPTIDGMRIKVSDIVILYKDSTITDIKKHHPWISDAQIHAALTYYYDHKEEMDQRITEESLEVEQFFKKQQETPGKQKLKGMGLI